MVYRGGIRMVKTSFIQHQYRIVLASKSPRRIELLKGLGFEVKTVYSTGPDEVYPTNLTGGDIPLYLAQLKSSAYNGKLEQNDILVTADTIVWLDGKVIGKPSDREEAISMLQNLSGRMHEVYTGVCMKLRDKEHSFVSCSKVFFAALSPQEIEYYVDNFKPFDKAGAYGIQEWVGYIGVEGIEGSYFNVMGLPVQRLYTEMTSFLRNF